MHPLADIDQAHHARLAAMYLASAIRWREEWRRLRGVPYGDGAAAMARRYMRQAARSWRRKWSDL